MKKNILLISCLYLYSLLGSAQSILNQFCETDGVVYSTLKMNNKVYIGGNFSYVGKTTGSLGAYNTSDLSAVNLPFSIGGTVNSIVRDAAGKIFIGGNFTHNGTQKNLLILNPDYSIASSPNITVNGTVNNLKISGDFLVISGSFSSVNGQTRTGMAAYNLNTNQLTSFAPNPDGPVNDFEVSGNNVWIGGSFGFIAGGVRNGLALVGLNNTLQSFNMPVNGVVNALEVKDSLVFIAGEFDSLGGVYRSNIASINTNTNSLRSWEITTDGKVNALAIIGTELYLGGAFYTLNTSTFRIGYASANIFTGAISSMEVAFDAAIEKLEVQNGLMHVYGPFSNVGNTSKKYFAILNSNGSYVASPIFNNKVNTSIAINNSIMVAGTFSSFGGLNQSNMAALDASTGDLLNWPIQVDGTVKKIIQSGNQILIGGEFLNINTVGRTGIALIDTLDGSPTSWDPRCNGSINVMELLGSTLILGGSFTEIGDSLRNNLASLDLNSTLVSSWNPNVNGVVNEITAMGQYLFVGGDFTQVGSNNRKFIASFNLANNSLRNWNINLDSSVTSISAFGDKLVVSGLFNFVNSNPQNKVLITDTINGTLQSWNPQFIGEVNSTHTENNLIFLGGSLQTQNNNGLVVYNGSTGLEIEFPIKVEEGTIQSMVKFEDRIALGGNFLLGNNSNKRNFGIFTFNVSTPSIQTQSVNISNINAVSARINISKGNGDKRVVLVKQGSAVDTIPINGSAYNSNSNFGDGDNINGNIYVYGGSDTSFVLNNLSFSTNYHVAVFEYNGFASNTNYNTSNPARTNFTTSVAFLPPTNSASNITFADTRVSQTTIKWTKGNGEKRLVLIREGSAVNQVPADSTPYFDNSAYGSGSEIGTGNYVLYNGTGDSVIATNLKSGTTYHIAIFEYNGIDQLARIKTSNPALGNVSTLAKAPVPAVPTLGLTITNVSSDEISLSWTNGLGSNRIVIASENQAVSTLPTDGEIYFSDNFFNGNSSYISENERVVYVGSGNSVTVKGLNQLTKYYFAVFEYNGAQYTSSYLKTNFPTADTTTRTSVNAPVFPSKDIQFIDKGQDYLQLSWTKGSGEKRLVVVKNKLSAGKFPEQGKLYMANTVFGLGDSLADGSFVVSNGDDTTVIVTGLDANTNYYFAIYEYNESAFGGVYLTDSFAVASSRTAVGLKKLKGQTVKIYPNPSNEGLVYIDLAQSVQTTDKIELFDIQGKVVKTFNIENWVQLQSNQLQIDVKGLEKGIYTLRYLSSKSTTSVKLNLN
ncbi:MAG: T9SS type A sorting domain-containing protein [Bacteroidia bacterium]|nr:T9SS type A sorting domain-containing protein [Bacteroidia bacterium]